MAAPDLRQLIHLLKDLLLRADIDATRRLVEKKDSRAPGDPFRDHDFLLISAAETSGELLRRFAADAESLPEIFRQRDFVALPNHSRVRNSSEVRQWSY